MASRASTAWARATGGVLIAIVSIGGGVTVGPFVADALGATGFAARLIPAAAVCAIAIALLALALRLVQKPARWIGLTAPRDGASGFALGLLVVTGSAALVFGAATLLDWVTWGTFDPTVFGTFLLTNTVLALLLEAIPEELILRGFVFSSLRERYGVVVSAIGTTLAFYATALGLAVAVSGGAWLLSGGSTPFRIAPEGGSPLEYYILLAFFAVMLVCARVATPSQTIWTSVAAHFAFLTVNRLTLFGDGRSNGWSMEVATPDGVLLYPAFVLVATGGFVAAARRRRRRTRK